LPRDQSSSESFHRGRQRYTAGSEADLGVEFRECSDPLEKVNWILLVKRNRLPDVERLNHFAFLVLYH
jgi:hypothetical protein